MSANTSETGDSLPHPERIGIGIGIALGTAGGAATGDIALWFGAFIRVGIAIGVALASAD
jgi:hypothetical protein